MCVGGGGYTGFTLSHRSVGRSPIRVCSITPLLMEGFPSNLNDTFTSTRGCAEPMFFPQHILPLLSLHNAQWWGYEPLTGIVLVWNIQIQASTNIPIIFKSQNFVPTKLIISQYYTCVKKLLCCVSYPPVSHGGSSMWVGWLPCLHAWCARTLWCCTASSLATIAAWSGSSPSLPASSRASS